MAASREIRFTQKDKNLYATVLAWPEEKQVIIKSLAKGNTLYPGKISKVELLGYGKVTFTRTNQGLIINMPDKQTNKIAPVFNVSSTNSKEFKLCVNSSFNIDTRLFRKTAIRSQCSKHVDNEIIETSMP